MEPKTSRKLYGFVRGGWNFFSRTPSKWYHFFVAFERYVIVCNLSCARARSGAWAWAWARARTHAIIWVSFHECIFYTHTAQQHTNLQPHWKAIQVEWFSKKDRMHSHTQYTYTYPEAFYVKFWFAVLNAFFCLVVCVLKFISHKCTITYTHTHTYTRKLSVIHSEIIERECERYMKKYTPYTHFLHRTIRTKYEHTHTHYIL